MKRILSLLLSVLLLFCFFIFSASADEAKTVYVSDFSRDEDGWYGRGAASSRTSEDTLLTVGRQSDWNSPGRDFDLVSGGKYDLSVEVRQNDLSSASFMISVAHSAEGTVPTAVLATELHADKRQLCCVHHSCELQEQRWGGADENAVPDVDKGAVGDVGSPDVRDKLARPGLTCGLVDEGVDGPRGVRKPLLSSDVERLQVMNGAQGATQPPTPNRGAFDGPIAGRTKIADELEGGLVAKVEVHEVPSSRFCSWKL